MVHTGLRIGRLLRVSCLAAFGLLLITLSPAETPQSLPAAGTKTRDSGGAIAAPALTVYLQPVLAVPMGSSAELFSVSGAAALGLEYAFAGRVQPFLGASVGYAYAPVRSGSAASVLTAEAGGGAAFWVAPRLAVRAGAGAGIWYGFLNGQPEGSFQLAARAGAGLQYLFSPAITLGLDAGYRYDLGLYQGLEVCLNTSVALTGRDGRTRMIEQAGKARRQQQGPRAPEKGRGIELANLELYEIFPVFHKFYDDHPVGLVTLVSREKVPITDIKLSLMIRQYMDSPKASPAPTELSPGERRDVQLMSLLTDRVLEVTEATKVAAELVLEYRMDGEDYRDARTITVRVLDRNAMTWEDDRRAAAFVTAKDPSVLTFAKGALGPVRGQGPEAVDENFLAALGLFTALDLRGLSYVVDPKTPFVEFSADKGRVDFLQFPRQTLEYNAGDCDDLSILYSALLEAVGIETAFVTVPGHIYVAFATGVPYVETARRFAAANDLVEHGGLAWVPVEVTERRGGFLKAWATGAREWREARESGAARLIPVHEAWREYEPVGVPGAGTEAAPPAADRLLTAFQQETARFVDRELAPRTVRLQEDIRKTGGSPAARNKLGVLYAQYGRHEQARAEFRQAVAREEYVPALVNLGNLASLQGSLAEARTFYERAAAREPKNAKVLLGLTRAYHQAEQFGMARAKFAELAAVDPALAQRFAYLGGEAETATRAESSAALARRVEWAE